MGSNSRTVRACVVRTSVDVFAEDRTITPVGATFTDDFGPYEAHVYIVR